MKRFFSDNSPQFKLLRTIVQGIIGVIISNLDVIIGTFSIQAELKPIITMCIMAVLSPVMAFLGGGDNE